MSDSEAFTLITAPSKPRIFDDYEAIGDGHYADLDISLQKLLRRQYPELCLTVTFASNVSLLMFAAGGNAKAGLDIENEAVKRFRYFYAGDFRSGTPDRLVESRTFAKYNYQWGKEYFIVYVVQIGTQLVQYILKEPGEGETVMSRNVVTDQLINAIGRWQKPEDYDHVYVFDLSWYLSKSMYEEVQKTNWDDVILNEDMKKTLTELMHKFFDSKDIYKDLGVPWKRGVIFHGPAGNGKTLSIKALMHSLFAKYGYSIPSLYVKAAPATYHIRSIFVQARRLAPCLLIFEDIDTIVTPGTRSYFFNEVDGLENNDGLFMVASTNHLDQLDPGLSSRPSRFDRKYLFPLPSESERVLYCEYWREKLKQKPDIEFPQKLCPAIAGITQVFSFAYLKEAFVATLIVIAGNRADEGGDRGSGDGDSDLDNYELWREMKKQVKQLRDDMDNRSHGDKTSAALLEIDSSPSQNSTSTSTSTTAATNHPILHPPRQLPIRGFQEPNKHISSCSNYPTELGQPVHSSQIFGKALGPSKPAAAEEVGMRSAGVHLDNDHHSSPLMTDAGMFMDSRHNRSLPQELEVERIETIGDMNG